MQVRIASQTLQVRSGMRIVCDSMKDPNPVAPGTEGTVVSVGKLLQGCVDIDVDWNDGRSLSLCIPPDEAHTKEDVGAS